MKRLTCGVTASERDVPARHSNATIRHVGSAVALCVIVWAVLTGRHVVDEAVVQPARTAGYADGICAALEMASAHGALDDITYQRVVKAMTTMLSPEYDGYAISHRDLLQTCARARAGSIPSRASLR